MLGFLRLRGKSHKNKSNGYHNEPLLYVLDFGEYKALIRYTSSQQGDYSTGLAVNPSCQPHTKSFYGDTLMIIRNSLKVKSADGKTPSNGSVKQFLRKIAADWRNTGCMPVRMYDENNCYAEAPAHIAEEAIIEVFSHFGLLDEIEASL